MDRNRALSEYLTQCRETATRIEVAPFERPRTIEDGYAVQKLRHDLLGTEAQVGYKIGCTTRVMQKFLSIDQPCGGIVRREDIHADGVRFATRRLVRGAVECEIAVRLGDTPEDFSLPAIARSVKSVMPAIELVDDRYDDYTSLGVPTLIADDFFHAGLVLGDETPFDPSMNLSDLRGTLRVNGEIKGSGAGRDILDAPLNALAWLAQSLDSREISLQPDTVVTLGSVVETWWTTAGETINVSFDRLGDVSCSFG